MAILHCFLVFSQVKKQKENQNTKKQKTLQGHVLCSCRKKGKSIGLTISYRTNFKLLLVAIKQFSQQPSIWSQPFFQHHFPKADRCHKPVLQEFGTLLCTVLYLLVLCCFTAFSAGVWWLLGTLLTHIMKSYSTRANVKPDSHKFFLRAGTGFNHRRPFALSLSPLTNV